MSDQSIEPGAARLPHSWALLSAVFTLTVVCATVAAAGIVHYLSTRTEDLRELSQSYIELTSDILDRSGIPKEAIDVNGPVERRDAAAIWNQVSYNVTLPDRISAPGLAGVLIQWAESQNASAVSAQTGEHEYEVQLALRSKVFATLALIETPVPESSVRDVSLATDRISDEALATIQGFGTPPLMAEITERVTRENESMKWTHSSITAKAESPPDAGALNALLGDRFSARRVRVLPQPASESSGAALTLLYEGLPCTTIALPAAQSAELSEPPLQPIDVPENVPPGPSPDTPVTPEPLSPPDVMTAPPSAGNAERSAGIARVAIVIDDGGRAGDAANAILALDPRLTVAVLPYEPQTAEIAERAHQLGFQVLLHMPMEPADAQRLYPESVTVAMTAGDIAEQTRKALAQVPHAAGVNNHEGSLFTSTPEAMRAFLEVVQSQGLFFLDSRTTPKTVAYDVAVEMQIPATKRDVFLDNRRDHAHIVEQFERLIEIAKQNGSAVAIGHFSVVTAQALSELLPRLQRENIELVHLSELVR